MSDQLVVIRMSDVKPSRPLTLMHIHADGTAFVQLLEAPYEYEIAVEDLNTPAKLVEWVLHLTGKTWCTTRGIAELVHWAVEHHVMRPHVRRWMTELGDDDEDRGSPNARRARR